MRAFRRLLTVAVIVACLAAGLLLWRGRSLERRPEDLSLLSGDRHRGGRLFFDKGCISCHAIAGTGGRRAPDLSRTPAAHLSLDQLVGVMWNHAPQIWGAMQEIRLPFQRIDLREMADLFAFLYAVRYFTEPGDPGRGRRILREKGCVRCHAVQGEGGRGGPDLNRWGASDTPILWAQRMWNHAPAMEKAMREKGVAWPEFQGDEMPDLLAYLRGVSTGSPSGGDILPADPEAGKALFARKGCARCHAVHGEGGRVGPDLGTQRSSPRTLTQMAGLMWNHTPQMGAAMRREGMERPQFSEQEMADLIAYLYSVRYFEESDDVDAGRRVFSEKRCDLCHSLGGEKKEGPDLGRWQGRISPVVMAYVMWNHGPKMFQEMQARSVPWPLFKGREMPDLIGYLNAAERKRQERP